MNLKYFLKKYKYDTFFLVIVLLFVLLFYYFQKNLGVFTDLEGFRKFIESFGIWGPLVIIFVIVLEIIFAPIPGFIPVTTAGFVFGPCEGAFYSFLGNIIGTLVVFFLARKFGKKIAVKLIRKERLNKYEVMIERNENWLLFFAYFIPILPTDIISLSFGLSKIKFKKFLIVSSLGFVLYSLVFNFFGDKLAILFF